MIYYKSMTIDGFGNKKGAMISRNPLVLLEPGIGLEPTTC